MNILGGRIANMQNSKRNRIIKYSKPRKINERVKFPQRAGLQ